MLQRRTILYNWVLRINWGVSWSEEWSCTLVWWLMHLFPDGSRVNRLWLGGCSLLICFGFCADISLYRYHWCSGKLVTELRAFLTWAMHKPCQLLRIKGTLHSFGEKSPNSEFQYLQYQCGNYTNSEIVIFSTTELKKKPVLCFWDSLYIKFFFFFFFF